MPEINDQTTLSLTMRPHHFDEVIGLESVIATAKNKIDTGAIPRAWLIKGPYGCGKTTLALIIARYIQGPLFDGQPQIKEVNGANYRKIDDVRALAKFAESYPMVGTYSVVIIDECHQLTPDAQQILLKELEIPKSPAIWILATTDPQKINAGVRDRCFPLTVEGMDEKGRHELIARGAAKLNFDRPGAIAEFEAAVTKAKIVSPRKILVGLEAIVAGTPVPKAISQMHYEALPEYFDIAMGVVYGSWDNGYVIPFIEDKATKQPKKYPSVAAQFKALDEKLKKATSTETAETVPQTDDALEAVVDEEDITAMGRPAVASQLRIIVAALLKNAVYKGGEKAVKAAASLNYLAQASVNDKDAGMDWSVTVGALYSIHRKLKG